MAFGPTLSGTFFPGKQRYHRPSGLPYDYRTASGESFFNERDLIQGRAGELRRSNPRKYSGLYGPTAYEVAYGEALKRAEERVAARQASLGLGGGSGTGTGSGGADIARNLLFGPYPDEEPKKRKLGG